MEGLRFGDLGSRLFCIEYKLVFLHISCFWPETAKAAEQNANCSCQ